jgi:hypothetical protein
MRRLSQRVKDKAESLDPQFLKLNLQDDDCLESSGLSLGMVNQLHHWVDGESSPLNPHLAVLHFC